MKFDIAIVGAGPAGASLAAALRDSGLRLALVEPKTPPGLPPSGFDARVYALSGRSLRFLEQCGAWKHVEVSRVAPVHEMEVFGDGDAARLVFSAYRSGVPELAAIVEEANLRQALERTLAGQPGLTRFDGATCASASWGDASLMLGLSDGRTLEASLVVAADGADSKLRALAGIDVQVKDYGQRGVVANFQAGVAHGNVARQWFRPDGVLALLPLPEGQVSMVWSTGEAHALALSQMDPDALGREVSAAAGGAPGSLRLAGPVHSFPLRRMHAARLIAPRLALLGDAAHSVHPLAGQGLNLGFGDAESLASVLARRGPESDCGARLLLRRYERSRKEAILAMEWVTDGLQALFDSRIPGAAALRNAGLRLTDGIPPLKRFLVKRALG